MKIFLAGATGAIGRELIPLLLHAGHRVAAAVGAAWLRFFPAFDPGYGFVDERTPELSVAVLAAHRGKGIGSLLVDRLLQGVEAASLSCDPANPAWRLYVRLGFVPLADGRTMLRMRSPTA